MTPARTILIISVIVICILLVCGIKYYRHKSRPIEPFLVNTTVSTVSPGRVINLSNIGSSTSTDNVIGTGPFAVTSDIYKSAKFSGIVPVPITSSANYNYPTLRIKIVNPQPSYPAGLKNGITSIASTLTPAPNGFIILYPNLTYNITVTGNNKPSAGVFSQVSVYSSIFIDGNLFGSGPFLDTSDIGKAAVFKGLVNIGETKQVSIIISPKLTSYPTSTIIRYDPITKSNVSISSVIPSVIPANGVSFDFITPTTTTMPPGTTTTKPLVSTQAGTGMVPSLTTQAITTTTTKPPGTGMLPSLTTQALSNTQQAITTTTQPPINCWVLDKASCNSNICYYDEMAHICMPSSYRPVTATTKPPGMLPSLTTQASIPTQQLAGTGMLPSLTTQAITTTTTKPPGTGMLPSLTTQASIPTQQPPGTGMLPSLTTKAITTTTQPPIDCWVLDKASCDPNICYYDDKKSYICMPGSYRPATTTQPTISSSTGSTTGPGVNTTTTNQQYGYMPTVSSSTGSTTGPGVNTTTNQQYGYMPTVSSSTGSTTGPSVNTTTNQQYGYMPTVSSSTGSTTGPGINTTTNQQYGYMPTVSSSTDSTTGPGINTTTNQQYGYMPTISSSTDSTTGPGVNTTTNQQYGYMPTVSSSTGSTTGMTGTGDTVPPLYETTTMQYYTSPPELSVDMEGREYIASSNNTGLYPLNYMPTFPTVNANPEADTTDPGAFIDPNNSARYSGRI